MCYLFINECVKHLNWCVDEALFVLEYPVWPYYLVHVTSCYERQKKHKNFSRPDPSVTQQWSLQQAIGRLKVITVGWCCPTECPCNLKILKDSVTASCKRKKTFFLAVQSGMFWSYRCNIWHSVLKMKMLKPSFKYLCKGMSHSHITLQ